MKSGFVTCVRLGLACMEEIYRVGGHLDLVVTLHDHLERDKSGRVYVDQFCQERQILLLKVRTVNEDAVLREIRARDIDWLFVIGWSQIVREPLLSAPKRGCVGIHPTLLPEGRGRAPIPWAIIKGLKETGVTLFKLDAGVDTGPIIAQLRVPIAPDETATSLYERVADAHRELIGRTWPMFEAGTVSMVPQDPQKGSEWPKRTPADGAINQGMTVLEVDRLVRATTHPYPGAFYDPPGEARRIRIWAGRPGSESEPPGPSVFRLQLRDGVYDAVDYEVEPLGGET